MPYKLRAKLEAQQAEEVEARRLERERQQAKIEYDHQGKQVPDDPQWRLRHYQSRAEDIKRAMKQTWFHRHWPLVNHLSYAEMAAFAANLTKIEQKIAQLEADPLCQSSCRADRIGTFGGADSKQWLGTDRHTRTG